MYKYKHTHSKPVRKKGLLLVCGTISISEVELIVEAKNPHTRTHIHRDDYTTGKDNLFGQCMRVCVYVYEYDCEDVTIVGGPKTVQRDMLTTVEQNHR